MGASKTPWTDDEKDALAAAVRSGLSVPQILARGIITNRSASAAYDMLYQLGETRRAGRWTQADIAALNRRDYAELYQRFTPQQIANKERTLRLKDRR